MIKLINKENSFSKHLICSFSTTTKTLEMIFFLLLVIHRNLSITQPIYGTLEYTLKYSITILTTTILHI